MNERGWESEGSRDMKHNFFSLAGFGVLCRFGPSGYL